MSLGRACPEAIKARAHRKASGTSWRGSAHVTCAGVAATPVAVFTSPRNQAVSAPGGAVQTTGAMAPSSWITERQTGSMK